MTMKSDSSYGLCIDISLKEDKICLELNRDEIEKRKKRFGKLIIFSDMLQAETGFLIDTYIEKNIIEDDFHLLKDSTIIRFRPIRHWTDSKIHAYAFCCVVSMTLIRVMQWMVEQSGYKMSPTLLKDELTDIKEVIMVYDINEAERRIVELSTVQKNLWKVFNLEEIKEAMLLHNPS